MNSLLTKLAVTGVEIQTVGDSGQNNLTGDITGILNIVIGSLALIAVIVVIIGGIVYMTSAGDTGKVKKGKDTILYGVIGLIICALAFAIVNWVVGGVLGGGGNSGGGGDPRPDIDYSEISTPKECENQGGRWANDMCQPLQ